jgi:hypothetical protein
LCRKTGDLPAEEVWLLPEVQRATDPGLRVCWMGILVKIGSAQAFPLLQTDLRGSDVQAADQAIALLASSSDPAPVDDLLAVAESSPRPATRSAALQTALQLAATAADEQQRSDAVILEWLRRADRTAQDAGERALVLGGLGRVKCIESFRLLAEHLPDPAVEMAAGTPMLALAPDLAKQGHAAEIKQAMERMAATVKDDDLRQKATAAAAAIQ